MKKVYSVCSKCLKVEAIPMFTDCTVEEAKKELKTDLDPQIVDNGYIFPCIFCGEWALLRGYDKLISILPEMLKNAKIVDK